MDYKQTLFPDLAYPAYLNHSAISPLSVRTRAAMTTLANQYGTMGVKAWGPGNELRISARQNLAQLIGAEPEDIALIGNTSQGLSLVACEYPWKAGDSMILFRGEFPGNVLPWTYAAERFGVKVLWLDLQDLTERNARFEEVMGHQPRLMAISWVQFQTGLAQSLQTLSELRETYDIHICLDAIQGLGPLTMDLASTPLDFVTAGCHKWLLSPEGTAFLYVNPERMPAMKPTIVSWISQSDASSFLFRGAGYVDYSMDLKDTARRYETGTLNAVGLAGLAATLEIFMEVGPAVISKRVLALASYCRKGLQRMGLPVIVEGAISGNVCTPLPTDKLLACMDAADKAQVIVSTPDGHLRVAPHFYNDEADIDRFLAVIAEQVASW